MSKEKILMLLLMKKISKRVKKILYVFTNDKLQ